MRNRRKEGKSTRGIYIDLKPRRRITGSSPENEESDEELISDGEGGESRVGKRIVKKGGKSNVPPSVKSRKSKEIIQNEIKRSMKDRVNDKITIKAIEEKDSTGEMPEYVVIHDDSNPDAPTHIQLKDTMDMILDYPLQFVEYLQKRKQAE